MSVFKWLNNPSPLVCWNLPAPIEPGPDNGGGGGGFPSGGGSTGGATQQAGNIASIAASGGLTGGEYLILIPVLDVNTGERYIGYFDVNDLDTETESIYVTGQAEIMEGRQITVSRVRIIYRDLGLAKLDVTVKTSQKSLTKTKGIGSSNVTGELVTDYVDMVVTGERPQLIISRKAGYGPVSIIKATMITDVEIAEQV